MKYKRSGTYELNDKFKVDPFTQKVSRSKSPNLIMNESLQMNPQFV